MSYWQKPDTGFTRLGTSLEAPFESFDGDHIPEGRFFVCNAGASVRVDTGQYRLKIKGDAVRRVVTLRLADLEALPQHEVTAYVECAGNQRTLFRKIDGHVIERDSDGDDVAWTLGGIGQAVWSGPRLADVLALAGLTPEAAWVAPMGLDVLNPECDIEIPMPIEKALDPDTLLGLRMNGAPLPVDHGAPVRMVVPGWVGTYWVKWVGWLSVSAREIRNYRTDEYYVIDGVTVTEQNIKASLCMPFPGVMTPGRQRVTGIARSPGQQIARVDWSVDGGDWAEAEILSRNGRWGWTRFGFDWEATPGAHVLRCRALDAAGRMQPEVAVMNEGTLLYNAVIPHPVTVG